MNGLMTIDSTSESDSSSPKSNDFTTTFPSEEETSDVDKTTTKEILDNMDSEEKDVRPKLRKLVVFKLKDDNKNYNGKVVQVGKSSGKNRNRAWIDLGECVKSFDFTTDVDAWKYVEDTRKVQFSDENYSDSNND